MATAATSFFGRQVDLNPVRDSGMDAHGHTFGKKTFHKPTFCHHCTDMLWGFIGQGYICEVCNFVSHDRCKEDGISPCATIAADRIKDPVPHTWSDPGHFRKKFCNVCRRRLDDALSLHCEACEYYTHLGCLDFVVSNCIRFIAYDESKELDKITVYHHWREGNLPTNSRCLVCKKSCATHECLASMKCEWCWATAHSGCYKSLMRECDMGPIRELIIPPWSVSMPVTMNMVKGDIVSRIQALKAGLHNHGNERHRLLTPPKPKGITGDTEEVPPTSPRLLRPPRLTHRSNSASPVLSRLKVKLKRSESLSNLLANARKNKSYQNLKNARHSLDSLTLHSTAPNTSPINPTNTPSTTPSSSTPSRSLDTSPTHRSKLNLPQLNVVSKSQGSSPTSPRTLSPSLYLSKASSPTKGPRPKSAVPCMQSSSKGSGSKMKASKSFDGGLAAPDVFFSSSKPTSLSNPHLSEPSHEDDERTAKPTLLSQALPLLNKYRNRENSSEGVYPLVNLPGSVMTTDQIPGGTLSNQSINVSGGLLTNTGTHSNSSKKTPNLIDLDQSEVDSFNIHLSGSHNLHSKERYVTTTVVTNGVGNSSIDPLIDGDPPLDSPGMMVISPTSMTTPSPPPTPTIAPIPTHPPLARTSVSMYRAHTHGQRSASESGLDPRTSEFDGDDDAVYNDDACLLQRNGAVRGRPLSTQIICSDFIGSSAQDGNSDLRLKEEYGSEDGHLVRLFDGPASLEKGSYHLICVAKDTTMKQLTETAMRSFYIADNAALYYLTEVAESAQNGSQTVERRPRDGETVHQLCKHHPTRIPSFILKYQEDHKSLTDVFSAVGRHDAVTNFLRAFGKPIQLALEYTKTFLRTCHLLEGGDAKKGIIKVYPGNLDSPVPVEFTSISITSYISVEEIIDMSLHKFGLEDEEPIQYSLVEMIMDHELQERAMERDECPWTQLLKARKSSLRRMQKTRYYLHKKDKCACHQGAQMFVGNLPINLSEHKYAHIIRNLLEEANCRVFNAVNSVYEQYGAAIVCFKDPEVAIKAFYVLKDQSYDDRPLTVLFIPEIHSDVLSEDAIPLLVFVNVKSGGCQGSEVMDCFKKMLNPLQVFDLDQGGPLPGLHVYSHLKEYRILICGGDGTVGWVLQCLDDIGQESVCSSPAIAILPLGTGNDLARVLKWGGGYVQGEDLFAMLNCVLEAEEVKLDRWTVIFEPSEQGPGGKYIDADNKSNSSNSSSSNDEMPNMFVMNNYFSLGIDADLCLGFHLAREEKPEKFNSRLHNKSVYFRLGVQKLGRRTSCKELNKEMKIEVDGKPVPLPTLEGILILNISSWGSGADAWGIDGQDNSFSKCRHDDGMLELVGLTGVVHLGQIQSGLRSGVRLAQGAQIRITMNSDMPVQVDGEPWMQLAGQVVVCRSALQATMLKKSKSKIKRRNTEPALPNSQEGGAAGQKKDQQGRLTAMKSDETTNQV